ncbi:multiple epidermal growth factor-like domains protein 8, partial [Zonotrichia leucophrys gambelii]|uniref:multiple epidermal growth factor-like domains protein 8 n=1 Tax=Zonotrichia leucophrys gambelii TaxID=257770 RepID=UPI00314089A8
VIEARQRSAPFLLPEEALGDSPSEAEQERLRAALVLCYGRVAAAAPPELLRSRLEQQLLQRLLQHSKTKEEVGRWGAQQERETRPLRRPRPERLFGSAERGNRYLLQVEATLNATGGLSAELTLTWDRTGVPGGSEISFFFLEPFRGSPGGCPRRPSCLSCLADSGCAWCPPSASCHPRLPQNPPNSPQNHPCGNQGGPRLVLHPQNCGLCKEHRECRGCAADPFCEWQTLGPPDSKRGDFVCSRRGRDPRAVRDPQKCPPLCSSRSSCSSCLAPYGECRGWADSVHSAPQCQGCSELGSCRECLRQHRCGWCGESRNPGLGRCFEGDFSGLHNFPNCSAAMSDHQSDHRSDHSDHSDHTDHHSDHSSDQSDHQGVPNDHQSDHSSDHTDHSDHRRDQSDPQ